MCAPSEMFLGICHLRDIELNCLKHQRVWRSETFSIRISVLGSLNLEKLYFKNARFSAGTFPKCGFSKFLKEFMNLRGLKTASRRPIDNISAAQSFAFPAVNSAD